IIHCTIGKADFESARLKENLEALLIDLVKAKPATAKGQYLQKIPVSSTMGPGVAVDQSTLTLKESASCEGVAEGLKPEAGPSKTAGAACVATTTGRDARTGMESPSLLPQGA